MSLLELSGVTKRFGGLTAVNNVTFSVEAGEIFGLIGPNGAGKSTLLNCLAGDFRPNGGTVRFDGRDTTGYSADRMCRLGIGRTFQIPRPFPHLSVLENVLVAATFGDPTLHGEAIARRAQDMLEYVEFPRPADTIASHLNASQLKRLDLARALASHPKLVLLDELASGLTPSELASMATLLRRIRSDGTTILMVEHVMRLILELCDRLSVLQYGELIAHGDAATVAQDERVREAYLGQQYIL
ncbi:MAG TPA: ABC transporter ATP-binding protein [Candidatus Acidoferrales bacterium]|jgi:branched-chain amino acid transport system ATP-binding protein|nr:ABC transporter ATP-binding protein [Candidatus Acidoferrales bacterium]